MGSKRAMLQNGLGELLQKEVKGSQRFVDLFTGSGAVAIHVARRFSVEVLAFDLQQYSSVLALAVVGRKAKLHSKSIWQEWYQRAESACSVKSVPNAVKLTHAIVDEFREWCSNQTAHPITAAYGGHYFSPQQALWIDALRATLPNDSKSKSAALAALIQAASQSAAAPGHTAQPFQPTRTAKPYLEKAWAFDIVERTKKSFETICRLHAKQIGDAKVCDANEAAKQLKENDVAFIDPPYSGEHYSRFYHVFETIANGQCGEVFGVGRYPAVELRPRSNFCLRTQSTIALNSLLQTVAKQGAKAILTFPDHECSNGLSGDQVREIASKHCHVREKYVESDFSTLGGTGEVRNNGETHRSARLQAKELMLVLEAK